MKQIYFNDFLTNKIFNDFKKDPSLTKDEMEEYIGEYPKDYSMYVYYADLLIYINELDKAFVEICRVERFAKSDQEFKNNKPKYEKFKYDLIRTKLKYYVFANRYEDFKKLYEITGHDYQLSLVFSYVSKQLGELNIDNFNSESYMRRQIANYQYSEFLDRLYQHQNSANDIDNPNRYIFSEDFPMEDVLNEIPKYILGSTKLNTSNFENLYIFKFDNCGRVNGKIVDFFIVICLKDSFEIIDMYPKNDCEYKPYVDLNYLRKDNTLSRVKVESQTEKFNRKYHSNY